MSEEIAELRRMLREDIRHLHDKLDKFNDQNAKEHQSILKIVADTDKRTAINATKVGLFVTLLTITVTGVVHAMFGNVMGG